jgi:hypothetical protein
MVPPGSMQSTVVDSSKAYSTAGMNKWGELIPSGSGALRPSQVAAAWLFWVCHPELEVDDPDEIAGPSNRTPNPNPRGVLTMQRESWLPLSAVSGQDVIDRGTAKRDRECVSTERVWCQYGRGRARGSLSGVLCLLTGS